MVIGTIVKHMHIDLRPVEVVIDRGKAGMQKFRAFVVNDDEIDHLPTFFYVLIIYFSALPAQFGHEPLKNLPSSSKPLTGQVFSNLRDKRRKDFFISNIFHTYSSTTFS